MRHVRLLSSILAVAILAAALAAATSAAEAPATFRLARISSHLHQETPGAVQDSHWSLVRKADPADPCGVAVEMKGSQRIIFGFSNLRGKAPLPIVLVTFHPGGRLMTETWRAADISRPGTVTPGTFELPATVTRKAEVEIGKPSAECTQAGDGVGLQPLPVEKGGCGTVRGKMHLRLSIAGSRLRVTGRFLSIYGRNLFSRCLVFPEHYPTPPEKRVELVETSWPLCETILEKPSATGNPVFDPRVKSVDIGSVDRAACNQLGVVTRRKGGATVSSYFMWFNRVKHAPAG